MENHYTTVTLGLQSKEAENSVEECLILEELFVSKIEQVSIYYGFNFNSVKIQIVLQ